jgi:hypothetical protein
MKVPVLALAACAAALLFAAPAHAQPQIIRTQLDSASSLMRAQGFSLQDDIVSGDLNEGEEEEFELELAGGKTYIIVGVCDGDCSDLDMVIATTGGQEVDSDYELDDVPMVMVEVASGTTYNLTVKMATCSVAPCAFGVGVFADS